MTLGDENMTYMAYVSICKLKHLLYAFPLLYICVSVAISSSKMDSFMAVKGRMVRQLSCNSIRPQIQL